METKKLMEQLSYAYMKKEIIEDIRAKVVQLKEERQGIKDAMQYIGKSQQNSFYCSIDTLCKKPRTQAFRWLEAGNELEQTINRAKEEVKLISSIDKTLFDTIFDDWCVPLIAEDVNADSFPPEQWV